MKGDGTKLGDYCKDMESEGTGVVYGSTKPLVVRVDGRAFHTFTRSLDKPYDLTMMSCMQDTAVELVKEFHPTLAFWQSDEITLLWMPDPLGCRELPFAGKAHKLMSVLAGMASSVFTRSVARRMPAKLDEYPHFDGRVFPVDDAHDAFLVMKWRQKDASRNAILGYAHALFGHRAILNKKTPELLKMIADSGHDFFDSPITWRSGEFLQRQTAVKPLEDSLWDRIPIDHRPPVRPLVERSDIISLTERHRHEALAEVARILGVRLVKANESEDPVVTG